MPPTIYYKNCLKISADGLGDGTIYGSATSATVDQANKRFTLTGFSWITDLGADSDDKANGMILFFPSSGNRYWVVDWEAATDKATTFEVPDLIDTGACELRRSLYEGNTLAANPAVMLVDGLLSTKWKGKQANQLQRIEVCLPNLIGQGGFEELAAGNFITTEQVPGKWWANAVPNWTISSTSPILGSRMAVWNGSQANLIQKLTSKLIKGRSYKIIVKCRAVGGSTLTDCILMQVVNNYTDQQVDTTWHSAGVWPLGVITTTAAWFLSNSFVPSFDTDIPKLLIQTNSGQLGSATAVQVDEVYIWEVVNVGALLAFNHNWNGATVGPVQGINVSRARSGFSGSDSTSLSTATVLNGSESLLREWTAQIFPIYELELPANTNFQYEAGEILLCEKWVQLISPAMSFDPEARMFTEERQKTISGAEYRSLYNEFRTINGMYKAVPTVDLAIWKEGFLEHHIRKGNPFSIKMTGVWDTPLLLRNVKSNFGTPYPKANFPDVEFSWEEVVA